METPSQTDARSRTCLCCGGPGHVLYDGLRDRLFGVPGVWANMRCGNPDCSLIWLEPPPQATDLSSLYANYYTHAAEGSLSRLRRLHARARRGYLMRRYGRESPLPLDRFVGWIFAALPGIRRRFDSFAMWLDVVSGGHLLEVGCGSGARLAVLRDIGWVAEGLDLDPAAIAVARARGLSARVGTLQTAGLQPAQYDAVVMCHVIEHLPEPLRTLQECWRVLRPGGQLALLTPNTESFGHRRYARNWFHLDPPRHLHLFNAANLSRAVEAAGFRGLRAFHVMRDAAGALGASVELARCGRYRMGEMPLRSRVSGFMISLREALQFRSEAKCAEELVVIAEK